MEKTGEQVMIINSKKGRNVLIYCGRNLPQNQPFLIGTRVISGFLPVKLLEEALSLIRANYSGQFLENALEDFYPRIRALVNKIYKGKIPTLVWLAKNQSKLVLENKDLFLRAVQEVKPKRSFPELGEGVSIKKEVLDILKGVD